MKKRKIYLLFVGIIVLNLFLSFEKENSVFSLKLLVTEAMAGSEAGGDDCWVYTSWHNIDNYQCINGCWGGTEEGIDECEGTSGFCESEGYWVYVLDCIDCTAVGCPADPGSCT